MQGRIYTCWAFEPDRVVSTSLFSTMLSGVRSDPRRGLLGDLDGANIAEPNWHSEMRHQYHVWQERLHGQEYVGFEHHRRLFFVNPLSVAQWRRYCPRLLDVALRFFSDEGCIAIPLGRDMFGDYLDLRESFDGEMKAHVDEIMAGCDMVTQRPHGHRIDEQFKTCHVDTEWDHLIDVVRSTRFFARTFGMIDFGLRTPFYCNMYVMRTELFVEYMAFWWECMRRLEERVALRPRYFGYFSERLANLFVYGKRLENPALRVRTMPFVHP